MKKGEELKIFLFRHGQTTFNRDGRFTGYKNPNLTDLGKKHAEKIAKELKKEHFEVAIHTSLTRSKDTLKAVLRFHPECKIILEDDRMIERSYGELAGKTHDEIIKKYGEKSYEGWHRGYYSKDRPPKGECFADVEKRVSSFIRDLKKFMQKNKVNVAISAHGNSIRLFRKVIESATAEESVKWTIPFDKIFTYKIS